MCEWKVLSNLTQTSVSLKCVWFVCRRWKAKYEDLALWRDQFFVRNMTFVEFIHIWVRTWVAYLGHWRSKKSETVRRMRKWFYLRQSLCTIHAIDEPVNFSALCNINDLIASRMQSLQRTDVIDMVSKNSILAFAFSQFFDIFDFLYFFIALQSFIVHYFLLKGGKKPFSFDINRNWEDLPHQQRYPHSRHFSPVDETVDFAQQHNEIARKLMNSFRVDDRQTRCFAVFLPGPRKDPCKNL